MQGQITQAAANGEVHSSSCKPLEQQGRVRAAEAERVGQGIFDAGLASLVRDVVQITLGVRVFVIDSRRQDLVAEGKDREASLKPARAAEQMPGHGLGGADGKLPRVF